jgi:hypothetical protein
MTFDVEATKHNFSDQNRARIPRLAIILGTGSRSFHFQASWGTVIEPKFEEYKIPGTSFLTSCSHPSPSRMPNMVNLLLSLLFLLSSALALECRPKGVIFPRPRNLKQSETFQDALNALTTTLNAAFNGDIRAGWEIRNVSLSMALVGFDQTEPSTPLWEYHHLASGNVNGTKSLDKHSQYLIGSVSKVITDAILIRTGVNMDDLVVKYLPVLNNGAALVDWKNISLRALGGQLAGIAPNCKFFDLHG